MRPAFGRESAGPVTGRPDVVEEAKYWEKPGSVWMGMPGSLGGHGWPESAGSVLSASPGSSFKHGLGAGFVGGPTGGKLAHGAVWGDLRREGSEYLAWQ